jgi:hypothetical protein
MPKTYEPISTQTLGSDTATVTFSSIPQTYTDLVVISNSRSTRASNSGDNLFLRFNSDSGTNYSATTLEGNGSIAESTRFSPLSALLARIPATTATAGVFSPTIMHIMNYTNVTTFKTTLLKFQSVSESVGLNVGLWRNTAAITTVAFSANNGNLVSGSSFTLYGVKSA